MLQIQLPDIFSDHMMLQRDTTLYFKGRLFDPEHSLSETSHTLTISLGETTIQERFLGAAFCIAFPSQPAGRNQTLSLCVEGREDISVTFSDISIGDIWLAAGQSNMEYFLRYDSNWNTTRKWQKNPDIRMYNFPQIAYEGQVRDLPHSGHWFEEQDKAWDEFSAPGYYFARFLQPDLNVPVGIIGCNWGGTPACAWMAESYLEQEPLSVFKEEYQKELALFSEAEMKEQSLKAWDFENDYDHQIAWRAMMYGMNLTDQAIWMERHQNDPVIPMGPFHHYRPNGLYHTMLKKLESFSIKGVLWYQGESDSGHSSIYDKTLTALIDCFRKNFQNLSLPFLLVQLAPFGKWLDCTNDGYAIVREKQQLVADSDPDVSLVSIMDLGMYEDIHPKQKMEVGRRLALCARGNVYHTLSFFEYPTFSHASMKGNELALLFEHVGEALQFFPATGESSREALLRECQDNFVITYSGIICSITHAELMENSIRLTLALPDSSDEKGNLSISYAEKDFCTVSVYNCIRLPLKPFHCQLAKK